MADGKTSTLALFPASTSQTLSFEKTHKYSINLIRLYFIDKDNL